jgi:hypothetical protein
MKSGKGIAILLLFLVGIPLILDAIVRLMLPAEDGSRTSLSNVLFSGYLLILPRYLWYLALAFTILYLLRISSRKKKTSTEDE